MMKTKSPSVANPERFANDNPNALSKTQVQSFFEEGYLLLEQMLSEEEVAKVKELVERAFPKAKELAQKIANLQKINTEYRCDYGTEKDPKAASILARYNEDKTVSIKLISWIGGIEPELIVVGRQPKITIPVAQLLGSKNMDHLINQIHYKMPSEEPLKHPIAFDWHQDEQTRRSYDPNWKDINKKGSFVQVITAVDETTVDNGPLIVIPKSHREYLSLNKVTSEEKSEIIKKQYQTKQLKTLLMKPGDTVFMHPLLVHKSDVNHSSKSRELFINGFSYSSLDGQKANHKPYPGTGSTEEITIDICCELLDETDDFIENLGNIVKQ